MEKLSQIREMGIDLAGADMIREPVPIRPGMHYIMGGIKTDIDGQTNVPGVYAAGECANVSVHGGNRLGANSLLDTIVFGERSGDHASAASRSVDVHGIRRRSRRSARTRRSGSRILLDRPSNGDRMGQHSPGNGRVHEPQRRRVPQPRKASRRSHPATCSCSRAATRASRWTTRARSSTPTWCFALELGFMLDCAEAIAVSAMERKDSRGAQVRAPTIPARDDENWLKHIGRHQGRESGPKCPTLPVTITKWDSRGEEILDRHWMFPAGSGSGWGGGDIDTELKESSR